MFTSDWNCRSKYQVSWESSTQKILLLYSDLTLCIKADISYGQQINKQLLELEYGVNQVQTPGWRL